MDNIAIVPASMLPLTETLKEKATDFSVVPFRLNFMLFSEENHVKVHKNQWLLNSLSPPYIPWGATHHGTPHGA